MSNISKAKVGRFDSIRSGAWTGPGQEMSSRTLWAEIDEGLEKELTFRLCRLADFAAWTYCGMYSKSDFSSTEFTKSLPWTSEWFKESTSDKTGEKFIQLMEGVADKFFNEIENLWDEFQLQRHALQRDESYEDFGVLSDLFSTKLTMTKQAAIQSLSMLMLVHITDALQLLRSSKYVDAAISTSNCYECLMHVHFKCERLLSGQSRGGKVRHANDPKSKEKEFIRNCWLDWRLNLDRYASVAEFARDMLDKTEHLAGYPQVVARWVREWNSQSI